MEGLTRKLEHLKIILLVFAIWFGLVLSQKAIQSKCYILLWFSLDWIDFICKLIQSKPVEINLDWD